MKKFHIILTFATIVIFLSPNLFGQTDSFRYELDLTQNNDCFNVTLLTPKLSNRDSIYSFVAHAPGAHQPLDFGRFIKKFTVYDSLGNEIITSRISTNDFKIHNPLNAFKIVYEIEDSFDMEIDDRPIYPMSGTGITENYTLINTFGVFGYFENLKNSPIELRIILNGTPKIGTSLNANKNGTYEIDSYYEFTDSPILIGDELSYAYNIINGMKVEVYTYSPDESIFSAQSILDDAKPILEAAIAYIGYAPVDRYTFLTYFSNPEDKLKMPIFKFAGALEHSLSSTHFLPAKKSMIPYLRNNIAHEFMHILSPLNLHSNELENFDYAHPASKDLHLWLYEGVTEWASYKMQLSAGLVSFEDYLQYLSEKINLSQNYSSEYSLTRISKEWATPEGNKQYNNIYQLGALTAAMFDIKLLSLSNGKTGLRELYVELIKKYGKNHPFDNDTFFETIVAMTYSEVRDFIHAHIVNNTPFDFKEELKPVGIKYTVKQKDQTHPFTMGLDIHFKGPYAVIKSISSNYQGTNLKLNDTLVRINGEDINPDIINALEDSKTERKYTITLIRNGEQLQIAEELYPNYNLNVLEIDPKRSEQADRLLEKLKI